MREMRTAAAAAAAVNRRRDGTACTMCTHSQTATTSAASARGMPFCGQSAVWVSMSLADFILRTATTACCQNCCCTNLEPWQQPLDWGKYLLEWRSTFFKQPCISGSHKPALFAKEESEKGAKTRTESAPSS